MKLLLFKTLLKRRPRDAGFTLPMVIALGLVMILLGTVSIAKSSDENLTASIQNSSSDALAVAEVGIAKYREFLNQNRILTVYNHTNWTDDGTGGTANVAGQTCNNMGSAPPGWAGATTGANNTASWWNVTEDVDGDGTAETIGQYRLVRYIYDLDGDTTTNENGNFDVTTDADTKDDPLTLAAGITARSIAEENDLDDDGVSDARGILTVQGRSANGSEAQISVDIPLRINDFDNLAPVVWVGNGTINNYGTLDVQNGNIVYSNPGGGCPGVDLITGLDEINDARSLPPIVSEPTNASEFNSLTLSGSKLLPNIPTPLLSNPSLPDPSTVDKKFGDRFFYKISSNINMNNSELDIDGASDVTLYVKDSDINVSGNSKIGNFNLATSNSSSKNLEIYMDDADSNNTITLSGNVDIEALIHAPDSVLEIAAGANVTIHGSVWVQNINNAGTLTVIGDNTDTATTTDNSYKFYTTTNTRSPRPIASSPTNWVKEEVE